MGFRLAALASVIYCRLTRPAKYAQPRWGSSRTAYTARYARQTFRLPLLATLGASMSRSFLLIILISAVSFASEHPEESTNIGEWLRASDTEPRIWAVEALFKHGGIKNYQVLKLLWVSDRSPEVRNKIVEGFINCECRYIAGDVFEYWSNSLNLFNSQEVKVRQTELAAIKKHLTKKSKRTL